MVAEEQRRQSEDAQIVQNHTPPQVKQSRWHKSPGVLHKHSIHAFQINRNDFRPLAGANTVDEHLLEADVRASQPPGGTDAAWLQNLQRTI
ncbi:MAG: hypothetical protein H0X24_22785, partial [Ktedonobacterales bacterium]|nr:hypothetical protein [Ktedonobacterales bacterium]